MTAFFDSLEGSLADIVNLIMIYFSRERAFPFQIMKVKFDGSTTYLPTLFLFWFQFFQLLIDKSYQILSRIMVIAVGQQLVEDVVACYGVFVCRHSLLFFCRKGTNNLRNLFAQNKEKVYENFSKLLQNIKLFPIFAVR